MNSYILLRNNKESSSLSLEDLQQIGLKSSDLIWVECQSVGWRNPHEITELKALVSVDRNQSSDPDKKSSADDKQAPEFASTKTVEKELDFAELPADLAPVKKQEDMVSFTSLDSTDFYKYGGIANSITLPVEKASSEISTKYSRPLDEIKEMYVKNMEKQEQSKKSIVGRRLPKEFKKVAVYTGFLLAGAVIMLLIKNTGDKKTTTVPQNTRQPVSYNTMTDTVPLEPVQINVTSPADDKQENVPIEETASFPAEEKRSAVSVKKALADKKIDYNEDIGKEAIEKNRQLVNEVTMTKAVPAENIASMVTINTNKYITGAFGGIRNLEMTLQNNSKYLLDNVTVELKYLNLDGGTVNTENIHFQSVQPGKTETIAVKKSRRGVKISYNITKIESKEVRSSTAGL